MLIIITDLCGSTNYAEKNKENIELIRSLYEKSIALQLYCLEESGLPCKIIKSTGDGLLITASTNESKEQILKQWIKTIKKLYAKFANSENVLPIRIVAHLCDDKKIKSITNLELKELTNDLENIRIIENINIFEIVLKEDIFGPQVNMLFRLSQAVYGNYIVVTNDFVQYLVAETEYYEKYLKREVIELEDIRIGPPIPLTYFKGINSIGFSGNDIQKILNESSLIEPFWVWEVS